MTPTADSSPSPHDWQGAFVPHGCGAIAGRSGGPLEHLSMAVKDIFDIAGHVTGCGNPDWLASHAPAAETATAVLQLLEAGADMIGKTITEELAYSLQGENFHYGTPVNPACPDRIPGGSSSGSASAVASGDADFALGSDTGGSVRIPAALCGLFGIRPSHGRVSLAGAMPLAPSFDTVGWFTREAPLLRRIGEILLGPDAVEVAPSRLYLMADGFELADEAVREALVPGLAVLAELLGPPALVRPGDNEGGLAQLMLRFRTLQAREIWAQHGPWIKSVKPRFGPEIAARFEWAERTAVLPPQGEALRREHVSLGLARLLAGGGVLVLPTAPSIAPRKGLEPAATQNFRDRTLSLTCLAGMARLPQASLPVAEVEGCPVGLSLVMARGLDMALLGLVERLAAALD
ncbi:MAG TPA: amidase [Hypericibacter adhaerens]|uniref:amidase n=1 Tax=Hypericibacter adhaerens TaxID=2602016 RepID=UPI002CF8D5B1|nr:amidase [Hypericibacter adhaerens]HWA43440.1 amidase [Hypericibacter adhaerens]